MAAYTDATKIAAYLGVTLSGAQQTQAGVMAQAASDWIDNVYYAGTKSWQQTSPVTAEVHTILDDKVYLNQRPVASITTVRTRGPIYVGGSWTTLTASQYELLSAVNGVLLIQGWGPGLAEVTYTHTATLPPSTVALAATIIAASWLGGSLNPGTNGVEQISVGQNDISVKFGASRGDVPTEALTLLGARAIVVA